MQPQPAHNNQKGFSTLEMLIAFLVVFLFLGAIVSMVFGGQTFAVDAQIDSEATHKAQAMLEAAQASSTQDFILVVPVTPYQDDIYTKSLDVSMVDLYTEKVTSNVVWKGSNNKYSTVTLTTLLTNPDAVAGGNTCSAVLSGDWTHPQKTEYEFGRDILKDTSSGFPITSIQSFNRRLYVTVNNTNGNNPGTFFVLDVSNPATTPVLLGGLDNAPTVGEGLNSVAVDGSRYAYVANAYGSNFNTCSQGNNCAQLQVIDIGVMPPTVVKSYKIPGITGNSGQGIGKSIFYNNGIVYLGLAKAGGSTGEFTIIDVGGGGTSGASSTNPILIGSSEINSTVNSIYVKDKYAYVASPDDQELKIFDIHIPSVPTLVGGFNAPGGGGNNGNGKSGFLVGNNFYFGRTSLNGDELYVLNDSNPETNLPILGSKNITDLGNSSVSVNGIIVRDYLGFLIAGDEFQVWKVNNPNSITPYAIPLVLPPGSGNVDGTTADCEGNYMFVGSLGSNDKGYISTITSGP